MRISSKSANFRPAIYQLLLVLISATLLSSCGEQTPTGSTTTTTVVSTSAATGTSAATTTNAATSNPAMTAGATTTTSDTATASTPAVVQPGQFQNPVLRADFPDPFVLFAGGTYYAYATNGASHNIQVASSPDLIKWQMLNDALPALPKWAKLGGSKVWAPEVAQIGSKYVMYYTARDKTSDKQCVGVATSDKPEGFFKDTNAQPLVCQADLGGTIDPDFFRDGDKLYLYFKNDGNCCGITTSLYVQELTPDGLQLTGQPTALVDNDQAWEGLVVEAPSMVKHDNKYFLFFSANDYSGLKYAVGYANCQSATGPCKDAAENPILKSSLNKPPVIGPGHQTFVQVGDQTWIVYHAWEVSGAGVKTDRRFVWLDKLDWQNGQPVVKGPTTEPQPAPQVK